MEDRYLFKAKRTDNGEWVIGSLIQTPYLGSIRSWISFGQEDKTRLREISSNQAVWRAFEVRTNTICQCTGLIDKNGKLIWENDILMCHGNKKDLCKVCFGEFKVIDIENMVAVDIVQGWYYKPLETDGLSKCEPFCYEMPLTNYYIECMDAEVIGNIFDNEELLESEG